MAFRLLEVPYPYLVFGAYSSFIHAVLIFLITSRALLCQLRFLMTGGVALEKEPPKPTERDGLWINDKIWGEIYRLSKVATFQLTILA
jgi:hypothetical protein